MEARTYSGRRNKSLSPLYRSPSPHAQKNMYVRIVNKEYQLQWYCFTVGGEHVEGTRHLKRSGDKLDVPDQLTMEKVSHLSSSVSIGSTVYYLGGETAGQLLDKVRCIGNIKWTKKSIRCPSMLNPRSNPLAVSLNGKIYVMGGLENSLTVDKRRNQDVGGGGASEPWAEVFDTKSSTWYPLSAPSPKPTGLYLFCVPLVEMNMVVIGSEEYDFFHLYNVKNGVWEKIDNGLSDSAHIMQPVAVGSTLLWFSDSKLQAYNLVQKWHFSTRLKGLKKILSVKDLNDLENRPFLIHFYGNIYCLICFENGCEALSLLHCVTFRVDWMAGQEKRRFTASVEYYQSYIISNPLRICDAVLMN